MSKERTPYFDIVKGIAVILVVLGHSIQYGSGAKMLSERLFYDDFSFRAIYSFHMSLFMLISGYLFWNSCLKHDWRENLIAKIKGLGIPIIAWGTVDFLIDAVSGSIGGGVLGR